MKKHKLFRAFLICTLLLLGINSGQAQWSARSFANGITVATATKITPKNPPKPLFSSYDTAAADGNIIYRILKDDKNKIYFGYDLEVKEAGETGKYTVFIKPLSSESAKKSAGVEGYKSNILHKYPDAFEVNEGDTIALDVMENPNTKEKVVDYIKIFYKPAPFTDFFAERIPIRDFTINDVELKLTKFEVFADNQSILKSGSSAGGANLTLYLKGKGQFIFSLFPRAGYDLQKIGAIEGNKILFKYNGVDYKIVSGEPIIGIGGHWNLWVLHNSNYKPEFSPDEAYEVGAMDELNLNISKP
ncbi:MAG: hypothetical protein ACR2LT_00110 [Pyrinomonadaceae bacterium]